MLAIIGSLCSWVFLFLYHLGNRGGGPETTIQQAPTTPAPSASESAEDIYQARLQYDPLVAEMELGLQQQYVPQQAELYQALYNQYYPQMARQQQALQQELFPQQSQIMEAGAGRTLQQLASPYGETPEETSAIEALRERTRGTMERQMRERSNLGGTLYGGRSARAETQAMTDLERSFLTEDVNRRMQGGQLAQQAAIPYMQIMYPQMGQAQPQISPYQYTSAVPQANTLYNAMFQASQPNQFLQQGQASPAWGMGGQALGTAAMMAALHV